MIMLLDSGPLGLATNPNNSAEAAACRNWLEAMLASEHSVVLPEIVDYEIRRELLRGEKWTGLKKLDDLHEVAEYLALDTETMFQAAELWAQARQRGMPTADKAALDIDVILAAQAMQCRKEGSFVIIATLNKKHLSQFVPAENWKDIHPL